MYFWPAKIANDWDSIIVILPEESLILLRVARSPKLIPEAAIVLAGSAGARE
jgi:hypothetical protein